MKKSIRASLAEMGITQKVLDHVQAAESQEEGERRLKEAKAICKKCFHELALTLHPDVNGGDEKKTEKFKQMKVAYEGFQDAAYKGWRKRKGSARFPDAFDQMFVNDPLMANFMRMKAEAMDRQEKRREDMLRNMFLEKLFEGRNMRPRRRGPRTRPHVGKKKGKVRPIHKATEIADGNLWYPSKGKWLLKTERPKKK